LPRKIIIYQTRLVSRIRKVVSVKFHKADDTATQTATASLETPMANPVDAEEDARSHWRSNRKLPACNHVGEPPVGLSILGALFEL